MTDVRAVLQEESFYLLLLLASLLIKLAFVPFPLACARRPVSF